MLPLAQRVQLPEAPLDPLVRCTPLDGAPVYLFPVLVDVDAAIVTHGCFAKITDATRVHRGHYASPGHAVRVAEAIASRRAEARAQELRVLVARSWPLPGAGLPRVQPLVVTSAGGLPPLTVRVLRHVALSLAGADPAQVLGAAAAAAAGA